MLTINLAEALAATRGKPASRRGRPAPRALRRLGALCKQAAQACADRLAGAYAPCAWARWLGSCRDCDTVAAERFQHRGQALGERGRVEGGLVGVADARRVDAVTESVPVIGDALGFLHDDFGAGFVEVDAAHGVSPGCRCCPVHHRGINCITANQEAQGVFCNTGKLVRGAAC